MTNRISLPTTPLGDLLAPLDTPSSVSSVFLESDRVIVTSYAGWSVRIDRGLAEHLTAAKISWSGKYGPEQRRLGRHELRYLADVIDAVLACN